MPRRPRHDAVDTCHHVMNRGIARRPIFETDEDRRFFLSLLAQEVRAGRIDIYAYSVMLTHFHLLVRSVTGEVKTTLPGVTFGASLPKLAALANQLAIVRSFTTGDGRHDIKPIVGRDTFEANLGAIHSRILGASHPQTGIPTNVALSPESRRYVRPKSISVTSGFSSP